MKPNPLPLLLWTCGFLQAQAPLLVHAEVIPVTEAIPEDLAVLKVIQPYKERIKATFDMALVECPTGLLRSRGGTENLLGYWVADAMRARAEALVKAPVKFCLVNSGGLRANLRPGTLKVADIYELMPFENELMVIELSGAEVVQVVKDGLNRRGGEPMSGVKAVLGGTLEQPELKVTWADGSAIDPKEAVKVAVTDYLYTGGDSFGALKMGRKPYTTGLQVRQLLLDTCQELGKAKRTLDKPSSERYLIPPEFAAALKEKTLKLR